MAAGGKSTPPSGRLQGFFISDVTCVFVPSNRVIMVIIVDRWCGDIFQGDLPHRSEYEKLRWNTKPLQPYRSCWGLVFSFALFICFQGRAASRAAAPGVSTPCSRSDDRPADRVRALFFCRRRIEGEKLRCTTGSATMIEVIFSLDGQHFAQVKVAFDVMLRMSSTPFSLLSHPEP